MKSELAIQNLETSQYQSDAFQYFQLARFDIQFTSFNHLDRFRSFWSLQIPQNMANMVENRPYPRLKGCTARGQVWLF